MANEYVGNIIPAPSYVKGNVSDDDELLASTARFTQKGVTLAPGVGILKLGTVMAQRTTDKKWVARADGGPNGTGVGRGVLRRGVDTGSDTAGRVFQGNVVISGILKLDRIVGGTAGAVSDLNARTDTVFNVFVF